MFYSTAFDLSNNGPSQTVQDSAADDSPPAFMPPYTNSRPTPQQTEQTPPFSAPVYKLGSDISEFSNSGTDTVGTTRQAVKYPVMQEVYDKKAKPPAPVAQDKTGIHVQLDLQVDVHVHVHQGKDIDDMRMDKTPVDAPTNATDDMPVMDKTHADEYYPTEPEVGIEDPGTTGIHPDETPHNGPVPMTDTPADTILPPHDYQHSYPPEQQSPLKDHVMVVDNAKNHVSFVDNLVHKYHQVQDTTLTRHGLPENFFGNLDIAKTDTPQPPEELNQYQNEHEQVLQLMQGVAFNQLAGADVRLARLQKMLGHSDDQLHTSQGRRDDGEIDFLMDNTTQSMDALYR